METSMREAHAKYLAAHAKQEATRDRILVPLLYEKRYPGKYRFTSYGSAEQFAGIDTIIEEEHGLELYIDEKIVEPNKNGVRYTALTLETMSCTVPGHEREGWMKTGTCDILLYCMTEPNGDLFCHWIEFSPLKKWFWQHIDSFPPWTSDQINKTQCRVVPVAAIKKNAPCECFLLRAADAV